MGTTSRSAAHSAPCLPPPPQAAALNAVLLVRASNCSFATRNLYLSSFLARIALLQHYTGPGIIISEAIPGKWPEGLTAAQYDSSGACRPAMLLALNPTHHG